VAADVRERPELALDAADDGNRLADELDRHEVAGPGEVRGPGDQLPRPAKDSVLLDFEHGQFEVQSRRQGVGPLDRDLAR